MKGGEKNMKRYYQIETILKGDDQGIIETIKRHNTAVTRAIKESSKPEVKEVVLYGYEVEPYDAGNGQILQAEERFLLEYYKNGKLNITVEG